MRYYAFTVCFAFITAGMGIAAAQEAAGPDPVLLAGAIAERCAAANQYTFDAVVELSKKSGELPRETVAKAKVKLAVAPDGRYLFWAGDAQNIRYLIVSDGASTWSYMPSRDQYSKRAKATVAGLVDPNGAFPNGIPEGEGDLRKAAHLILPILAGLARNAAIVEMNRFVDVNYQGEDRRLPVLSILSNRRGNKGQSMTELVVEPSTAAIVSLEWTKSATVDLEERFTFLKVEFEKLQIGDPVPASYFAFTPPDGAKLVDQLPVPGLQDSAARQ
jgi:outer membrane lipoprotein-sorting protein